MIRKIGLKGFVLIIVVLMIASTITFVACSGPSVESKREDLQKSITKISANVAQLDNYIMEWKLIWQNVATGQLSFEDGVKKLNEMSVGAQEVSRIVGEIGTPRWLSNQPRSEFDAMKRDVSLAANAISVASKAGAQMLKSGKLTAADVGTMANYTKEASNYLNKTIVVIHKFRDGYGIDATKQ